jgi:NitT/TauT family transport system substrate-binding protein
VAASAATAGGPAASVAPEPTTPPVRTAVKVRVHGRPEQAQFEIAYRRGYFERLGLDVDPVPLGVGAEVTQSLATNQIQVGSVTPNAALFNVFNRGIDVRLVADWAHVGSAADTTIAILVRDDLAGQAASLAALKGTTFANGGAPGSIGDLLLQRALDKDDLTWSDLDVVYLPIADITAGLANRKVEAGMLTEPAVTQAEQDGIARVLYPAGVLIPGAQVSVLAFSPEFAAQTDAATRFLVGYLQGVRDYSDAFHLHKDRDAVIALLTQYLSLKDAKTWEAFGPAFVDLNGQIDVADLQAQAAFHAARGALTGPAPDVAKFVDTGFAEAAVRQLGRR